MPERACDDLVLIAAAICQTPIALLSLVDDRRQWFKAKIGLDPAETPRDLAFCAHAILDAKPLVVNDTALDPRFATNPLVTGDPNIRFYAGVPLVNPECPGPRDPVRDRPEAARPHRRADGRPRGALPADDGAARAPAHRRADAARARGGWPYPRRWRPHAPQRVTAHVSCLPRATRCVPASATCSGASTRRRRAERRMGIA